MSAASYPISSARTRPRTALIASADGSLRQKLAEILTGMRWQVREADGGAEAWSGTASDAPEAMIVDSWLPDLELSEFLKGVRASFPAVDLLGADGSALEDAPRCPHRQELLYALRRSQETDGGAGDRAPQAIDPRRPFPPHAENGNAYDETTEVRSQGAGSGVSGESGRLHLVEARLSAAKPDEAVVRLPELIGDAPAMFEVSRRIRLVAPRDTPVLIEGPTGSGKEVAARALHRLSTRCRKPFVAINSAAIPETLLEAELFGHTRGAFTGAVQGRVGRIESADGGTLFLDEIGEMPLALQAKLLRFVESGELQRVGDNENVKVDVRIVAATNRSLAQQAQAGGFRADLYYRLAVFLIRTPALAEHLDDLPLLVDHFLKRMGCHAPVKRIDSAAMALLCGHTWPGNVRELEHVLERAAILAGDVPVISAGEIDFGPM